MIKIQLFTRLEASNWMTYIKENIIGISLLPQGISVGLVGSFKHILLYLPESCYLKIWLLGETQNRSIQEVEKKTTFSSRKSTVIQEQWKEG